MLIGQLYRTNLKHYMSKQTHHLRGKIWRCSGDWGQRGDILTVSISLLRSLARQACTREAISTQTCTGVNEHRQNTETISNGEYSVRKGKRATYLRQVKFVPVLTHTDLTMAKWQAKSVIFGYAQSASIWLSAISFALTTPEMKSLKLRVLGADLTTACALA